MDSRKDRAFSVVDCYRRKLGLGKEVKVGMKEEIRKLVGVLPGTERETEKVIRSLSRMVRRRRINEKMPGVVPREVEEVEEACELLERFSMGRMGMGEEKRLREILGGLPRTRNVAASWKKKLEIVVRKRKRKLRAAEKKVEIEVKRTQRRAKREKREAEMKRLNDNTDSSGSCSDFRENGSPSIESSCSQTVTLDISRSPGIT